MGDASAQPFDPENYLLADHQSPGLVAIKPSFESNETPPPTAEPDSSPEPDEGEVGGIETRRKPGRRTKKKGTPGDVVVLNSDSQSEADQEEDFSTFSDGDNRQMTAVSNPLHVDRPAVVEKRNGTLVATKKLKAITEEDDDGDFEMPDAVDDESSEHEVSTASPESILDRDHTPKVEPRALAPAAFLAPLQKSLDLKPPPKALNGTVSSPPSRVDYAQNKVEGLATSRALAKFTIDDARGDPDNRLPAMQASPPRSSSIGSADHSQRLPPLSTLELRSDAGSPYAAHSPGLTRASPAQTSAFGPSPSTGSYTSPYSATSPGFSSTNPSLYRSSTRDGSISTPSDYTASSATTASASTPGSSLAGHSPAAMFPAHRPSHSYSEPAKKESDREQPVVLTHSIAKIHASTESNGSDSTSPTSHGPTSTGPTVFKCTVPNCTASPFQTQYLLSSHMNVHSDMRPHFCLVPGCNRGPDGQGFKRKNEMIRHGLVHTSPGYTCPFCSDQQHKYPRPDNLQRHVRVHHMDKDKDHPLLREVLAQRPEGGSRGRRRRIGG